MRYVAVLTAGFAALAAGASLAFAPQGPPAASAAGDLLASAAFTRASTFIASDYDRFVDELVALTEIPAPPFKEERRAAAYLELLRAAGLRDVEQDPRGNVMGVRPGNGGRGMLAVAAHLDTVFPEGTDVRVRRAGTRLMAPGVGDNTRGLALLLAVVRALDAGGFETPVDLLFVGNVGEEGEGDLRGVKYLLREGKYRNRITAFLAIDGGEQGTITRAGVGSRRYRVTYRGPGGHSYGAFGLVNPAYAMAAAIARLADTSVPASPKTTFNVGAVRGGTSVNSIPSEVSTDVDLRSESCTELRRLEAHFLAIVQAAAVEENRQRSTRQGRVAAEPALIGDRPCGDTPAGAPIVAAASAAVRAFGLRPAYADSSTDSNIPMSMGIPALTIGRGGAGGRAHAPDEWTDVEPESARRAVEVALAIVLMVAKAV